MGLRLSVCSAQHHSIKEHAGNGESSSLSSIFDSVPFTGVQLATDEDMIPESLRGFAPIVRGIARTNARVVIKQNGYQIYRALLLPVPLK